MLKIGCVMKKSNKVTVFYILSSVLLFLTLIFGGVYGIYISSGVSFMGSVTNSAAETANTVSNVSIGGGVATSRPTVTGIVILSIILIIISILDLVSLIKQIVFFKQFKMVRESNLEEKIERKVKSKGSVVFFTILIDITSFAAGVAGIFLNSRTFVRRGIVWILYLIDGVIAALSLLSFVLLIVKLKQNKKLNENNKNAKQQANFENMCKNPQNTANSKQNEKKIDLEDIEYNLLKLKTMRSSKMITQDEFLELRKKILPTKTRKTSKKK